MKNAVKNALKVRAKKDVERKIRKGKVNKNTLILLRNLYEAVYPYLYKKVSLVYSGKKIEAIPKDTLFGIKEEDNAQDIIWYYTYLKKECVSYLKDINNTNYEMIKILACLDALCNKTIELKSLLRVTKKEKPKLYTYLSILEVFNENVILASTFHSWKDSRSFVDVIYKFCKAFEASEK